MQVPANFDSVSLDALINDWVSAMEADSVEGLIILGPDGLTPDARRCVRVVHPPRYRAVAEALVSSDEFEPGLADADEPMVLWQSISYGNYLEMSRWRVLALSHGMQSMVRVSFLMPKHKATECYFLSSRSFQGKTEAASLVWSALSVWPKVRRQLAQAINPLSPREVECLSMALDGLTAAQTAFHLGCGERTVNYYLANAMRKFGVDSKLAAVERAIWLGLL